MVPKRSESRAGGAGGREGGEALPWLRKPLSGSGLQDSSLPAYVSRPSHFPGLTSSLPVTLKLEGAGNREPGEDRCERELPAQRETQDSVFVLEGR